MQKCITVVNYSVVVSKYVLNCESVVHFRCVVKYRSLVKYKTVVNCGCVVNCKSVVKCKSVLNCRSVVKCRGVGSTSWPISPLSLQMTLNVWNLLVRILTDIPKYFPAFWENKDWLYSCRLIDSVNSWMWRTALRKSNKSLFIKLLGR